MLLREDFEKRELSSLVPYAVFSSQTAGRKFKEPKCPTRTEFQRDRDRIIHSSAFRRLEYKTQVFVNHEGDYYRTRLTHTLEVAQISRNFARSFRLNEDLSEAIALAHDLGHTPFGHSGEEAMDKLMKDHGGFEHNQQSYRVVTKLEHRYPDFVGLNLTHEVLEGIAKHIGEYDKPDVKDFKGSGHPILEAQIVNFADEIAYLTHDVDDGLTSGLLKLSQLEEVNVLKKMKKEIIGDYPNIPDRLIKYQLIRRLINLFVTDMQEETKRRLSQNKLESLNDVRTHGDNIVGFSPAIKTDISELRSFLFKNLYRHPKVSSMSDMARAIIENLFRLYKKDLELLPKPYQTRGGEENAIERNICDYIAGMTDRFALKEHQRLCE